MITQLSLKGFRAFRQASMEFERLTVIVGPNASGKTSILRALQFACDLLAGEDVSGLSGELSHGAQETSIDIRDADPEPGLFRFGHPTSKALYGVGSNTSVPKLRPGPPGRFALDRSDPFCHQLMERFAPAKLLKLSAPRLAEPVRSDGGSAKLATDGYGLAAVLAHMWLRRDENFSRIEEALKSIVPGFERLVTDPTTLEIPAAPPHHAEKHSGYRLLFDMRGAGRVSSDAAGEGTLLALGLLAVLYGPNPPRVVLLDDIELALHPAAQERLVSMIRTVMELHPNLQIVATSHSPFILNALRPEEIRMTMVDEAGDGTCGRLIDHPQYDRWKDSLLPGEMWSTLGESWLNLPKRDRV